MCRIQWYVHFFCFWPEKPFLVKFGLKIQKCFNGDDNWLDVSFLGGICSKKSKLFVEAEI